ncbi:Aldose 1-epimerase [Emticicia oligotrophica DSM 17448]|uniref:Aldose 1-epimerase n=1 Tax=Emticicia oligotrophica (strain DSM 17448 / CIP 109782 / MTCC 6937 / GPTSA100-15) TaxID=929562 RepID=A0ABM5N5B9_EMTOG|nr:aldose 1-epimerase family protein [Emticicia oligotrophica]AFK04673.1 Aldose 1-epimerase [Emticicia oligotrophica DSM 17448]
MMYYIENEYLEVGIDPKGAELFSIYNKQHEIDYVWGADPEFWGKSSPVLFPIVGGLKDNTYFFEDKEYSLPRHGFARDYEFEVEDHWDDGISFLLRSNEETLKVYPFEFELRLVYELYANLLSVTYHVTNVGEKDMYFSIGGHPAFNVPLEKGLNYDDFHLEFETEEAFMRWPLSEKGLILEEPVALLGVTEIEDEIVVNESNKIPLTKELFHQDALVFKQLNSTSVTLKSENSSRSLRFDFAGFPYLGIWAAKNADFVCIEPWCGIADSVSHSQNITEKEGINFLPAGEVFERAWAVKIN